MNEALKLNDEMSAIIDNMIENRSTLHAEAFLTLLAKKAQQQRNLLQSDLGLPAVPGDPVVLSTTISSERERLPSQLLLIGLEEGGEENDEIFVRSILRKLGKPPQFAYEITLSRIGRPQGGRTRFLQVQLPDEREARDVLEKLEDGGPMNILGPRIKIGRDLKREDQEKNKIAMNEVKKRNLENNIWTYDYFTFEIIRKRPAINL